METDKVIIYADGGARGNGKPDSVSGWGVVLQFNDTVKELYGSAIGKTNNFMELTGVIKALEALKTTDVPIVIYSDSKYVVDSINKGWVRNWKARNWIKSNGDPVPNKELWQHLMPLSDKQKHIRYEWVRGHDNSRGNLRADTLANVAMDLEEQAGRLRG